MIMKNKFINNFFIIFFTLLISCSIVVKNKRNANFYRLENDEKQTIFLLGTIHGSHLDYSVYSLWHIKAVIENIRPDLLIVESRAKELTKENLGDGPIEMPFAYLIAKNLNLEVGGFDWWTKESYNSDSFEREDSMVKNIISSISGYNKILVLIGLGHIEYILPRLEKGGFLVTDFSIDEKEYLFNTEKVDCIFPKDLAYYIQKRIDIDKNQLEFETDDEWKERLKSGIEFREDYIKFIKSVGEKEQ